MSLREYQAKRDFARTREPAGQVRGRRKPQQPCFVIQKHAARRLHYDFRIEMEGVLKSWAVPKGFPTRKGDRRLAVQVEDHPLEYGRFEGTIPEGSYGAGTVMVWDTGTYEMLGGEPVGALQSGKLHFALRGKKLRGEWTLVRMRQRHEAEKPQWLLLKSGSDLEPISPQAEDRSALTRRSLEQIAGGKARPGHSDRPAARSQRLRNQALPSPATGSNRQPRAASGAAPKKRERRNRTQPELGLDLKRLPKADAAFLPPMKALLTEALPKGPDWVYEVKFDGVRALAIKTQGGVALISRAAKELTGKYAPIAEALARLPATEAVLDGEIVAVDEAGRSAFQLLQSYQSAGRKKPPLLYYVFDALNVEGKDLTGLPLWQRKQVAQALVAGLPPAIRFSASIKADSKRVMKEMQARGLEGLLAKQRNSTYEVGQRSGAWVKFKWTSEQEFVLGGYTEPQGARTHFGALLVGYYEGDQLLFAGKVGTGFNRKRLESLYQTFQPLKRPDCPFANLPEKLPPESGSAGLTAAKMRFCTWLEPRLVCEVRFAEWTRDNHLRQPAFLGLREDKDPREVVRERAAP